MIRPAITQQIIDNSVEIIESGPDGEGIPYYGQPEGVYEPAVGDEEDEMERARR